MTASLLAAAVEAEAALAETGANGAGLIVGIGLVLLVGGAALMFLRKRANDREL